jgi:hypothetical protein
LTSSPKRPIERLARRAAVVFLIAPGACGSRSAVDVTPGPPPPPECTKNEDCPGFDDRCAPVVCEMETCQEGPVKNCDDGDPCTIDSCDPATGACLHPRSTLDLDGDGHYAPLPGKRPTDPDSCGDDCDDTNPNAHPNGVEVCDGVDNDCNGIVDDGTMLIPAPRSEIQVSTTDEATAEGLVGFGGGYLSAYSGIVSSHASVYLAPLRDTGARVGAPVQFTTVAADAFGGPLVWLGDRFGLTWSDRRDARDRDDNYEIYFNLVNPDTSKRLPDVRITQAPRFSINPAIAWTGSEFIVLWQDDGLTPTMQNTLFGQRLDVNGTPIGSNLRLANDGYDQTPSIAVGQRSVGIVWMRGLPLDQHIMFAVFDQELQPIKAPVELTTPMTSANNPVIVFNRGQYVIAWHDQDSALKTVYAAVKGELGEDVIPTRPLVRTTATARYPSILPYGDRLLFVWSDTRDGNQGYEVYANLFDLQLVPLLPADLRLTNAIGDGIQPIAAFGPNGDAGILFTDDRTGMPQAFFTRLACVASAR